jgi:hypothetical protein
MNEPDGEDWVKVKSCAWIHEAHFLVSVLEGEGLEAFIPDAYTLGVDPGLAPAFGGVRILVHRSDLQRATEALAAVQPYPLCD